jgi:Transposase IS66 family
MRIGALYGIEEEIRGKPAELRSAIRQARARPLLDSLRHWMERALGSLSKKSEAAAAIRYSLSHWRALTRYVDVPPHCCLSPGVHCTLPTLPKERRFGRLRLLSVSLRIGRNAIMKPIKGI